MYGMWYVWGRSTACGTYGGGVRHVAHMGEEYGMWQIWRRSRACGTYEGGVRHVAHMGEE